MECEADNAYTYHRHLWIVQIYVNKFIWLSHNKFTAELHPFSVNDKVWDAIGVDLDGRSSSSWIYQASPRKVPVEPTEASLSMPQKVKCQEELSMQERE